MIYSSKYLVPKGYAALTLFPFVFVKHSLLKSDKFLINHEKIHLKQQLELLILPFFIWYGLEFLLRLARYKNWSLAYKNIAFEREAYQNDSNLEYLNSRSIWGFIKYL